MHLALSDFDSQALTFKFSSIEGKPLFSVLMLLLLSLLFLFFFTFLKIYGKLQMSPTLSPLVQQQQPQNSGNKGSLKTKKIRKEQREEKPV